MQEKIIKNSKAKIIIYSDYVVKNYHNKDRNVVDLNNHLKLNELFKDFEYQGWNYKCVEIIDGSREAGIKMNKISGVPMISDSNFEIDHYFKAGVLLGFFHKMNNNLKNNKVYIYDDFTFANIFIDYETKSITAMDLGPKAFQEKTQFYDIVDFFFVAITSFLKRKIPYNKKCIDKFIKGYNVYGSFNFNKDEFNEPVSLRFSEMKENKWWVEAYGKVKLFLMYNTMVSIFKFHLIPQIKKSE